MLIKMLFFMVFIWPVIMTVSYIFDLLSYPVYRYIESRRREKWEKEYRNWLFSRTVPGGKASKHLIAHRVRIN